MTDYRRERSRPRGLGASRIPVLVSLAVVGALLSACSNARPTTTTTTTPSPTVWLCEPGAASDPCAVSLLTTEVSATGARTTVDHHAAVDPPADCFYVYPTVSNEKGANADLQVQGTETSTATQQAAPFSQVCRVWAPMYRQATVASLLAGGVGTASRLRTLQIAYDSLLSGFEDYLAHDNDGRPIVFIGHSQGAVMLIKLLENVVEKSASLRHRLVSAVLAGANVQVPTGKLVGGTFRDIAACSSTTQTGCVMAWSTFDQTPPSDTLFGRPGTGVSLESGQTTSKGMQVLCTNPTSLSGGIGQADAAQYLGPSGAGSYATPWVEFPNDYQAECKSESGVTWLQVSRSSADVRPEVSATLGPAWGLHLYDINLVSANLVQDVGDEIAAFTGR